MPKFVNILDMTRNPIINVTDPSNTQDAATKHYVDNGFFQLRIKRVQNFVDAASVTPDVNNFDVGVLATLSQGLTLANPIGTPTEFQAFEIRITSLLSETLAWDTKYRGSQGQSLPTTTTGSGLADYFGFKWNALSATWDLLAYAAGF